MFKSVTFNSNCLSCTQGSKPFVSLVWLRFGTQSPCHPNVKGQSLDPSTYIKVGSPWRDGRFWLAETGKFTLQVSGPRGQQIHWRKLVSQQGLPGSSRNPASRRNDWGQLQASTCRHPHTHMQLHTCVNVHTCTHPHHTHTYLNVNMYTINNC